MNLIDGLIINTLNEGTIKSKHSLLMEFYDLDKEIATIEAKRWEDYLNDPNGIKSAKGKAAKALFNSYELSLYFMRFKAHTLLKILDIN